MNASLDVNRRSNSRADAAPGAAREAAREWLVAMAGSAAITSVATQAPRLMKAPSTKVVTCIDPKPSVRHEVIRNSMFPPPRRPRSGSAASKNS
jgi:hypothetical protein